MADSNISLNRFGLGARSDDPAPADLGHWLAAQWARMMMSLFADTRGAPIVQGL